MNRRIVCLAVAVLLLFLLLPAAYADDAGVLSENELNTWVTQVLRDSTEEQPLNAPVGEESHTEEGYAFIYSFATLYYDKPVLDANSVLKGISVTGEDYPSPRGIKLGSPAQALLDSYGWQNPSLMGDGSLAALYRLSDLPRAAYWCWAQHEGDTLQSVQCAVHVGLSDGRYTDAGLIYTLENNAVVSIRVYGLSDSVTADDVNGNLNTVMSVQAAGSGDDVIMQEPPAAQQTEGYAIKSEAAAFSAADLKFAGIDYLALTESGATLAFGAALEEQRVQDDTGAVLLSTQRDGLALSYTVNADGSSEMESMAITADVLAGPRGVRIGATLKDVLAAFGSDGEGRVVGNAAALYGDGVTPPFGLMERMGENGTELRYAAQADRAGKTFTVTLNMTFTNDLLTELMIYSW